MKRAGWLSTSLWRVPLELTVRLPDDHSFGNTGHINYYSRKSVRRLVQSCGFEVVRQVVRNPSVEVYRYNYGIRGVMKHLVKEVSLHAAPELQGPYGAIIAPWCTGNGRSCGRGLDPRAGESRVRR